MGARRYDAGAISEYRNEIYGTAILWIMLFHGYLVKVDYFAGIPGLEILGRLITYGNAGVESFLFLSGISLYFSYVRNPDAGQFLKKRLRRVYLPVILLSGAYWLYMCWLGEGTVWQLIATLSGMRFWLDGSTEIWFVSVILVCYLIYPYVYAWIFRKDVSDDRGEMVRTLLLMAAIMLVTYSFCKISPKSYKLIEVGLTRFPVFILGCGCGKLIYEKRKFSALAVNLLAIIFLVIFFQKEQKGFSQTPFLRWGMMLGGVAVVLLLAEVMRFVPQVIRKILTFLGNMSLELYIAHLAGRRLYERDQLFFRFVSGSTRRWLLVLLLAVIAARAALLAERQIGRYFGKKRGKNL